MLFETMRSASEECSMKLGTDSTPYRAEEVVVPQPGLLYCVDTVSQ